MKGVCPVIWGVAAVIGLAACGSLPQSAQRFVRAHTACLPSRYDSPAWSPDNTRIVYLLTNPASTTDLHLMTSQGKSDRLLATNAGNPRVSPDGTMVLFSRIAAGGDQLSIVDINTRAARDVLPGVRDAAWSPDSRWLLYASPPPAPGQIYKADAVTGQEVQLTDTRLEESFGDESPIWSPDGRHIAFASSRGAPGSARASIFIMDADGSHVHPLAGTGGPACTQQDLGDTPRAWLPDGRLVYDNGCWRSGSASRRIISPDGTGLSDLGWMGPQDNFQIAWSPVPGAAGGSPLIYTDANPTTGGLTIANADGSGRRLLQAGARDAHWSPDGTLIAFVGADAAGVPQIFTIRPDGTGLTQLTDNPGGRVCLH